MIREEHQDRGQHETAGERAAGEFFAAVREETKPSGAMVLSDASGRWFYAFCQACSFRGQAAKDHALIQARADQHNERHA